MKTPTPILLIPFNLMRCNVQGSTEMAIKIVILYPAGIYVFQLKTRNNRSMCGICSELTLKTSKRRHGRHSGVFIVDF